MKLIFNGPFEIVRQLLPGYRPDHEVRLFLDTIVAQLPWTIAVCFSGELQLPPLLASNDEDCSLLMSMDHLGRYWQLVLWGPTVHAMKDNDIRSVVSLLAHTSGSPFVIRDLPLPSCAAVELPVRQVHFCHQRRLEYQRMQLRVVPVLDDPNQDIVILHDRWFGDVWVDNVRVDEVEDHGVGYIFARRLMREFSRFRIVYMSELRTRRDNECLVELHRGWRGNGEGSFRYSTPQDFLQDRESAKMKIT